MRPFDSISHKDSKILGRVILCHRMVAFLPTRGSLVGLRVAQITGCRHVSQPLPCVSAMALRESEQFDSLIT